MTTNEVRCESCRYIGAIDTFPPTASIYSDIRCPKCSSTNNKHNDEYLRRLQKAIGDRDHD